MNRRFLVVLAGATVMSLAFGTLAAFADQGTGTGQTPRSAAIGFVAKSDLTGQLNYVADPLGADAGFVAHCDGYTSFKRRSTADGFPKIVVTATCIDQDGSTVYLRAAFTDRGVPGTNDSVCILWSYDPAPVHSNSIIHDHGKIQAGNIQILDNPDTGLEVELFSTE
jgi:hypothetical protein